MQIYERIDEIEVKSYVIGALEVGSVRSLASSVKSAIKLMEVYCINGEIGKFAEVQKGALAKLEQINAILTQED